MGHMTEPMALVRHRIGATDYYRMAQAGLFGANDRVELIEGEIVARTPAGSRHASVVKRLNLLLAKAAADRLIVAVRDPLHLAADSGPEPDLMLLAPRPDFYASAHPAAADVSLLIEVGDTSLRFDREVELPLYARHRIAEVWLIDLEACRVELCRALRADGSGYGERRIVSAGFIAPQALPAASIDVAALFPWQSGPPA